MRLMNYAQVIHNAWEVTVSSAKLKWFAFFPALAVVSIFMIRVAYQVGFFAEEFQMVEEYYVYAKVRDIFVTSADLGFLGWTILFLLFAIFFAYVVPAWVEGVLILGVKRIQDPEKRFRLRESCLDGWEYFWRLAKLHAALAPFALISIGFFSLTFYRVFHNSDLWIGVMLPLLIGYSILSFCINLFCAYAPYYIVLDNMEMGAAVKKSIRTAFLHFGTTLSVLMLMFLVNLRVIVNVLVVVGVPIGIFFAFSFFTGSGWLHVALVMVALLGLVLLSMAAYLTAILDVFMTGVWKNTFDGLRAIENGEDEPILTADGVEVTEDNIVQVASDETSTAARNAANLQ